MTTDTKALRELLARATAGPWEWRNDKMSAPDWDNGQWTISPGVLIADTNNGTPGGDSIDRANACLLLASVNSLPAMLDEIDDLRARVAELEGADQWQPIEALPELPMDERIIAYWPNEKIIAMKSIRGITCLRQKDRPSHWRPMLFKAPETAA